MDDSFIAFGIYSYILQKKEKNERRDTLFMVRKEIEGEKEGPYEDESGAEKESHNK